MSSWAYFKEVLEKSVEKNGTKPLTNTWVLNMINLAEKMEYQEDYEGAEYGTDYDYWRG